MLFGRHDQNYIEYYSYFLPTSGTTLAAVVFFARSGIYDPLNGFSYSRALTLALTNVVKVIFLLIACFFIFKISDNFSRLWLIMWTVTSAVALCGFRLVTAAVVRKLIHTGRLTKAVAVVGANAIGQEFCENLRRGGSGTRLVGLFDERRSRIVQNIGASVIHHLSALDELLCRGCVDEIVIAIPASPSGRILELVRRFHPFPVSLRLVSPPGYECFQILDSRRYGEFGTFCIMGKPLDEAAAVLKRLEDIVIALICLLFTLPLLLLIALCIKLDSPGPVFFRQKRLGANNLPFDLLKFRSMYVDRTDPLGQQLTQADDPRITRVGRMLRRTSMDELPQLINVLRGDMSLVGPRPHALAAKAAGIPYAHAIGDYPIRHRVKPGITGWAQVNGWRGETVTIEQIRRRVEYDLYYIENWSLPFDFLILGRTVFAVLSRANAV
jgi:Undecaprenyl-phosphate glucose phosphotransferase